MSWTLMLSLILAQPAGPEVGEIVSAWRERARSIESADVSLMITRDSRHSSFGAPLPDGATIRLRFDGDRRRLDLPRHTVVRRDGRTGPAESNPDRARIEFRNVLIEEELKGPQIIPFLEPASLIIDERGTESGQQVSALDRLLAEAPLWSAQPLRFLNAEKLQVAEQVASAGALRLREQQSVDRHVMVWVEPDAPYAPLRLIQYEKNRPAWQLDLTWSTDEPRLATTFVAQTINGSGESLDFVEARLGDVVTPLPASADWGTIGVTRDQPAPPDPVSVRRRAALRHALDSNWLPLAVFAVAALVILAGRGRKRAIS